MGSLKSPKVSMKRKRGDISPRGEIDPKRGKESDVFEEYIDIGPLNISEKKATTGGYSFRILEFPECSVYSYRIEDEDYSATCLNCYPNGSFIDASKFISTMKLQSYLLSNLIKEKEFGVDYVKSPKRNVYEEERSATKITLVSKNLFHVLCRTIFNNKKAKKGPPPRKRKLLAQKRKNDRLKMKIEKERVERMKIEQKLKEEQLETSRLSKILFSKENEIDVLKKKIYELENAALKLNGNLVKDFRKEYDAIITELKGMSNEHALELGLNKWLRLVEKLAPLNCNFFKSLIQNTYDDRIGGMKDTKEMRATILVLVICRNKCTHMTKFGLVISMLMKGFGQSNEGVNFFNQLLRLSVSSTLLYSVMKPYAKEKITRELNKSDTKVLRFVIDNFALKFHNKREHVESLTRLVYAEGEALIMTPSEMRKEKPKLNKRMFYLNTDEELNIEFQGFQSLEKKVVAEFCVSYKSSSRREIISLEQQIPAYSSSDVDVCECLIAMDELIPKKFVRKFTSDQQIVAKCLNFQSRGYFTNWIFEYGKLHGEKDLSMFIMNFAYHFVLEDLAIELGEYYINEECKYIQKTYNFLLKVSEGLNLYFKKDFENRKFNGTFSEYCRRMKVEFKKEDDNYGLLRLLHLMCCLNVFSLYYSKNRMNMPTWDEERYFLRRLVLDGKYNYSNLFFKGVCHRHLFVKKIKDEMDDNVCIAGVSKFISHDHGIEAFHGFLRRFINNSCEETMKEMIPMHHEIHKLKRSFIDELKAESAKKNREKLHKVKEEEVKIVFSYLQNEFGTYGNYKFIPKKKYGRDMIPINEYVKEIDSMEMFSTYVAKKIPEFMETSSMLYDWRDPKLLLAILKKERELSRKKEKEKERKAKAEEQQKEEPDDPNDADFVLELEKEEVDTISDPENTIRSRNRSKRSKDFASTYDFSDVASYFAEVLGDLSKAKEILKLNKKTNLSLSNKNLLWRRKIKYDRFRAREKKKSEKKIKRELAKERKKKRKKS